jgi:hypothetical protein
MGCRGVIRLGIGVPWEVGTSLTLGFSWERVAKFFLPEDSDRSLLTLNWACLEA